MAMRPGREKVWIAPVVKSVMNMMAVGGAVQIVDPVRVCEMLVSVPSDGLNLSKEEVRKSLLSRPEMATMKSWVIVFARAAIGTKAINPITAA